MIGVMNLIPYFGSIISSVIAVIITIFFKREYSRQYGQAWHFLILEQVDGNFIGPKNNRRQTRYAPFVDNILCNDRRRTVRRCGTFVIRTCHDCDKDDIYGYFGGKGKAVKRLKGGR